MGNHGYIRAIFIHIFYRFQTWRRFCGTHKRIGERCPVAWMPQPLLSSRLVSSLVVGGIAKEGNNRS
jgi:hypothetical protein